MPCSCCCHFFFFKHTMVGLKYILELFLLDRLKREGKREKERDLFMSVICVGRCYSSILLLFDYIFKYIADTSASHSLFKCQSQSFTIHLVILFFGGLIISKIQPCHLARCFLFCFCLAFFRQFIKRSLGVRQ